MHHLEKYYIFYKINDLTIELKYLKYTNLNNKTIKLKQATQNNKLYISTQTQIQFFIELVFKFNIIYNSYLYIVK